jgi:hypothetical protein
MINTKYKINAKKLRCVTELTYLGQNENRDACHTKLKQTMIPVLPSWKTKPPKSKFTGPGRHARNTHLGGEPKGI